MNDQKTTPSVEEVTTPVSTDVTTPETETIEPEEGQAEVDSAIPVDDPIVALATKKGWDVKQAPALLAKSYIELESKLGNYKEVEKRAALYEEARQKAELWDSAQRYIETQGEDGTPDLSKLSTQDLASLWENGQVGLADMPADKQFEVQRFVNAKISAQDNAVTQQAQQIFENNPILKDPTVLELVATRIENGIDPDQAISEVKTIMQKAEKSVEERFKKDTEMIRNGNLESSGSPASTVPKIEIKSVADAFRAAKAEMEAKN